MKSLLFGVVTLLTAFNVYASSGGVAPYTTEVDNRFNTIETLQTTQQSQAPGNYAVNHARVQFVVNGTNGQPTVATGLGFSLPAKSVIVRSWYYTTATTGAATSTVAFSCETANNIKTATDMHAYSADTIVEGQSTGAASAFAKITATCVVTATVATATMTSGTFDIYIDYVVHS